MTTIANGWAPIAQDPLGIDDAHNRLGDAYGDMFSDAFTMLDEDASSVLSVGANTGPAGQLTKWGGTIWTRNVNGEYRITDAITVDPFALVPGSTLENDVGWNVHPSGKGAVVIPRSVNLGSGNRLHEIAGSILTASAGSLTEVTFNYDFEALYLSVPNSREELINGIFVNARCVFTPEADALWVIVAARPGTQGTNDFNCVLLGIKVDATTGSVLSAQAVPIADLFTPPTPYDYHEHSSHVLDLPRYATCVDSDSTMFVVAFRSGSHPNGEFIWRGVVKLSILTSMTKLVWFEEHTQTTGFANSYTVEGFLPAATRSGDRALLKGRQRNLDPDDAPDTVYYEHAWIDEVLNTHVYSEGEATDFSSNFPLTEDGKYLRLNPATIIVNDGNLAVFHLYSAALNIDEPADTEAALLAALGVATWPEAGYADYDAFILAAVGTPPYEVPTGNSSVLIFEGGANHWDVTPVPSSSIDVEEIPLDLYGLAWDYAQFSSSGLLITQKLIDMYDHVTELPASYQDTPGGESLLTMTLIPVTPKGGWRVGSHAF